jgi:ABC-2 type transport system permease protein
MTPPTSPTIPAGTRRAAAPRERPVREVWIVARREIVAALGRRGFLAGTALLLAVVGYGVLQIDPAQPVVATERGVRVAAGLGAGVLICFALVTYGLTLAQGVVEEKSSRVVELLLATIRPWQLLAGKVIGVGVSGLVQLGLLVGGGTGLAVVTGRIGVEGSLIGTAGLALLWFVLGFALYATLLAAAASTVSRQEDVPSAIQPALMVMVAPFVVSTYLVGDDPGGPLVEWLSLVPLFSPFLMPARTAIADVPLWQGALAAVLTAGAVALTARLAGRVYSRSVLRTGGRVGLAQALGRR